MWTNMSSTRAAQVTMINRQGVSLGPFNGLGGRAPRQPENTAAASRAAASAIVRERPIPVSVLVWSSTGHFGATLYLALTLRLHP